MRAPTETIQGFWPDPEQQLLLEACLLEGERARRAWEGWRQADIDNLDQGSFRLLPLLSRSLRKLAVEDPCLAKIQGVHRHFWVRNQRLFHGMARVLGSFAEARIPALVLKGAPLALAYYGDPGLRPMNDLDILIRPGDRERVLDLLAGDGWRPIYFERFSDLDPSYLSFATSHGFRDAGGLELDVHWYLFPTCSRRESDQGLWERAVDFQLAGSAARAPSPVDLLLHVCGHGAAWNEIPPIRWVADAVTIIDSSAGSLEWNRLPEEAAKHGLSLVLAETLGYLRERFRPGIPADVLDRLRNRPPTAEERLLFRAQNLPLQQRGLLLEWQLLRSAHRRWLAREELPATPLSFFRVLQHTAKRTGLLETARYALRQGLARKGGRP